MIESLSSSILCEATATVERQKPLAAKVAHLGTAWAVHQIVELPDVVSKTMRFLLQMIGSYVSALGYPLSKRIDQFASGLPELTQNKELSS